MLRKFFAIAVIFISFAFTGLSAHEVLIDTHAELIPIPAYSNVYGQAGAEASLKAAQRFLDSFKQNVRSQMIYPLNGPARRRWSNLPASNVTRSGLSVGEMSDEQRALLFEFLSASLGEEGYRRIMDVMAAEAFLSTDRRARRLQWAPENYWIAFFGTPAENSAWGWQYGGHHLGLDISVEGNLVESMSPSFVGTEPAVFRYKGVDYASVIDMHTAGYAVYDSLNASQKRTADAKRVPSDVLTGPGEDGVIPSTLGIRADEMTARQRQILLQAIRKWVLIQPEENALPRMAEIEADLDETYFAWIGSNVVNTACYMRIQGPELIIELVSTGGNVGESAAGQGHYHTIYRNPKNEYGQGSR